MPFELHRIVEILDGEESASELMQSLVQARLSQMRDMFSDAMARFADRETVARVLAMYNDMDSVHKMRLLVSAEMGEALAELSAGTEQGSILESIEDMTSREHAVLLFDDQRPSLYLAQTRASQVFSPLGDRSLEKGADGMWRRRPSYLLDGTIAVDFDSPVALRTESDSGTMSSRGSTLTDEEKEIVRTKLETALYAIDAAMPVHGQVIRNFVRRIVVRKTADSSEVFTNIDRGPFGSEHRPLHPSSFRALNIHHPQKTVTGCMESMLHETIHNVLAYWEMLDGHFAPSERDIRPISPWSGNPIPNHSFAHAVFVWYGLHRLFHRCATQSHVPDGVDMFEIHRRLKTFGVGFLIHRRLSDQFTHSAPVHASLAVAIDAMQDKVQRIYAMEEAA